MMCEGGKPPGLTDRSRWQRGHAGRPLLGKRLNRPCDVVCRSDGSIYFTGPGMCIPPIIPSAARLTVCISSRLAARSMPCASRSRGSKFPSQTVAEAFRRCIHSSRVSDQKPLRASHLCPPAAFCPQKQQGDEQDHQQFLHAEPEHRCPPVVVSPRGVTTGMMPIMRPNGVGAWSLSAPR